MVLHIFMTDSHNTNESFLHAVCVTLADTEVTVQRTDIDI